MTNVEIFEKNKYCVVNSAISDELRDFITQYSLFDEMQNFQPEKVFNSVWSVPPQVPNAHSKYADPVMETTLLHLQPIMEKNTGLKLLPTYSYFRVYRPGDDLKPHLDRPSCEISATLCFNYSYDKQKYKWPIFMEGNRVELDPGDLVIYRGCELEHWREEFDIHDQDAWHVQGFFHYVDANGPYSDWKYDKRNNLGEKPKSMISPKEISEKKYIQYL